MPTDSQIKRGGRIACITAGAMLFGGGMVDGWGDLFLHADAMQMMVTGLTTMLTGAGIKTDKSDKKE